MFSLFILSVVCLSFVLNVSYSEEISERSPDTLTYKHFLPNSDGLCTLNDGTPGVCKHISECPSVLEELDHGKLPEKICGFSGTRLISCCKDGVAPKSMPKHREGKGRSLIRRPRPPPPILDPIVKKVPLSDNNRSPGDITKQKCKFYAKYAHDTGYTPALALVRHHADTLDCTIDYQELIIGGKLARPHEFPHMALIGYESEGKVWWACGGSLISENFVLTAGHCLINRQLGKAKIIRLGLTNQSDTTTMQEIRVSEIIGYPEYENEEYHDIGLLKLSSKPDLNPYVRPACLHTEKQIPFQKAVASGFGRIGYKNGTSKNLLKVVLDFYSTENCADKYQKEINSAYSTLKKGIVEDLMICAGSSTKKKDTCEGDSGGPLQVYHKETKDIKCMYDIVGVTAFGKGCGLAIDVPGVYTRVSAYLKWIEDVVWP